MKLYIYTKNTFFTSGTLERNTSYMLSSPSIDRVYCSSHSHANFFIWLEKTVNFFSFQVLLYTWTMKHYNVRVLVNTFRNIEKWDRYIFFYNFLKLFFNPKSLQLYTSPSTPSHPHTHTFTHTTSHSHPHTYTFPHTFTHPHTFRYLTMNDMWNVGVCLACVMFGSRPDSSSQTSKASAWTLPPFPPFPPPSPPPPQHVVFTIRKIVQSSQYMSRNISLG